MKINIRALKDEELVKKIREENKEFYKEIIKRYEDKLLRYASYLIGKKVVAEDAVQNTFIKAYININGFNQKKVFPVGSTEYYTTKL